MVKGGVGFCLMGWSRVGFGILVMNVYLCKNHSFDIEVCLKNFLQLKNRNLNGLLKILVFI